MKVRPVKVRLADFRLVKVRLTKVRSAEVSLVEVGPTEVRPDKIRLFCRILLSPPIPDIHSLLQNLQMLWIRHFGHLRQLISGG